MHLGLTALAQLQPSFQLQPLHFLLMAGSSSIVLRHSICHFQYHGCSLWRRCWGFHCSSKFDQNNRVGIKEGTEVPAVGGAIDSMISQDSKATVHYQDLVVELETLGSALRRVS